jgi:hypothetical protein
MRWLLSLVPVVLLGCHAAAPPTTTPAGASGPGEAGEAGERSAAPRPPVVVTIAVDQLAAWVLAERLPLLPADGGFARLRREGTYAIEARHAHAATDTAPGHAALYTGGPPSVSGVFSNEIIDPATRKRVSILRDPATHLVGVDGALETIGSSTAIYRTELLADRLRAERPDAFITSFSLKDRSAIPGGGRRPDAVVWYDGGSDAFVTSTAFAKEFPAWAAAAGKHAAVEQQRAVPWTMLHPAWVTAHARSPDNQPGEGEIGAFGAIFPHDHAHAEPRHLAFRASPASDERLLALALAAIDQPRFGQDPTLLAISFSANDYVGHVFGPDSWEAWDLLDRLDTVLARLFSALDRRVGPDRYAVLLSADHGDTPMPETMAVKGARPWCTAGHPDRWERPCVAGGRLYMEGLGKVLQAAAERAMGPGDWVLGATDPFIYLGPAGRALPEDRQRKLLVALEDELARDPLVARTIETRSLPKVCPPQRDESLDALVCRSFSPGAGELYVVPRPGVFFDSDYVVGKGTSHGSPSLHDRTVPLLVRAPGRVEAGKLVDSPIAVSAFARTAASLLGVAPPAGATEGPDLSHP